METIDVDLPVGKVQELMGDNIRHYLESQAAFSGKPFTLWDLSLSAYFIGTVARDTMQENASVSQIRKKRGLSQKEAADRIGISRTYLGQVERGKAPNLTLETALKICEVLGCDVKALRQKQPPHPIGEAA